MQGVKGFPIPCPEEPALLCMQYNHWHTDQIRTLVFPKICMVFCGRRLEEKRNCRWQWKQPGIAYEFSLPHPPLFFNTRESLMMLTELCIWNCPSSSHRQDFLRRKEPINSMALNCRCKQPRKTQAGCKTAQSCLCRWAACALPLLTEGLQWRIHSITSLETLTPRISSSSTLTGSKQHWFSFRCKLRYFTGYEALASAALLVLTTKTYKTCHFWTISALRQIY